MYNLPFVNLLNPVHYIVFVWFQYNGGNIEQRTIGYDCPQNQEAKLKIVGGVILWSNQQEADPTSSLIYNKYIVFHYNWLILPCITLIITNH